MRPVNVCANGFPKTGNHGLVKAFELLGIPASINHRSFADGLPVGTTHHIHIKRDPRNVVISMLRFNREIVTPGTFIARFRRFQGAHLTEEMERFQPWLLDPKTLIVAYEDLIADDRAMRRIATFVGTPYLDGAWARLPGRTYTWNDEHSDYRKLWNRNVAAVWADESGNKLLAAWGYKGGQDGATDLGSGI